LYQNPKNATAADPAVASAGRRRPVHPHAGGLAMLGVELTPATQEAGTLVGVVLLEAMVLYVGYGLLIGLVGDPITRAVRRCC